MSAPADTRADAGETGADLTPASENGLQIEQKLHGDNEGILDALPEDYEKVHAGGDVNACLEETVDRVDGFEAEQFKVEEEDTQYRGFAQGFTPVASAQLQGPSTHQALAFAGAGCAAVMEERGIGYRAQLEATISGDQLGQLLASSDARHFIDGHHSLTVEVDEASVAALYAAAGAGACLTFEGPNICGFPVLPGLQQEVPIEPLACEIGWQTSAGWVQQEQQNFEQQRPPSQERKPQRQGRSQNDKDSNPQQQKEQHEKHTREQQQQQSYSQQHHPYQTYQPHNNQPQDHRHHLEKKLIHRQGIMGGDELHNTEHRESAEAEHEEDEAEDNTEAQEETYTRQESTGQPMSMPSEAMSDIVVVRTRASRVAEPQEQSSASGAGARRYSEARRNSGKGGASEAAVDLTGHVPLPSKSPSHGEDEAHATGLQVRSVQLLGDLSNETRPATAAGMAPSFGAKLSPRPFSTPPRSSPRTPNSKNRPSSKGFGASPGLTSRPTTVGSTSPSPLRASFDSAGSWTRPGTMEAKMRQQQSPLPLRPSTSSVASRPDWDNSFYTKHEQRIPVYDALLDKNCPMLSNPSRLRHLIHTRELSDAHLHIVRSRFEQHRQMFDHDGRLGEHFHPVPMGIKQHRLLAEASDTAPDNLADRIISGFPDGDHPSLKFSPPPGGLQQVMKPAQSSPRKHRLMAMSTLLCSPEWQSSALHEEVLDEQNHPTAAKELGGKAGIVPSFQKIREEIAISWHKLQIPLELRTVLSDGHLTAATPDSLYRLKAHFQELQNYEAATKKLILEWLQRDTLLEAICGMHALGVNDTRLTMLRADLQKLDRLSTSLVRDIGHWCRRFGDLIVDTSRDHSAMASTSKPRPIFVWGGRDAIERIQADADRLSRGDLTVFQPPEVEQEVADAAGAEAEADGGDDWSQRLTDWGFARASSGRGNQAVKAQKKLPMPASPLAAATVAGQSFKVADVLFEGPAPSWYRESVAKAGIKALKRGQLCGGGDKRM
eukprot:TRINITY_DN11238_c0_g1_i1.p1 TRINITY_DN11238_c0_g1~~TRINITY_DN11238_c0_g1_i1.p1  ORF type:complete len:1001 (+),score=201.19 TRINITY_DN11238_c0_g1_i1:51-3053(+)